MEEQRPLRQEIHGNLNATSVYGDAHVHYEGLVSSVLPEHVWMVQYRRNGFFTGRETLLTALHTSFTKDRTAVLTQGQAINGLGGIGKTQVAVEYAYRHRDEYRFVLWASAATHETLISAFVKIAERLQLPERTLQEQDKIVTAVSHWLSTNEGWLLIVDNADELAMIWSLLPTGSTGHVLVTTRDQATGDLESFLVEQMDRVEGTLLLLRRAHILQIGMELEQVSPTDRQIAEQIVAEMDGLPLALDQAGAYVEETRCSLAKYLERYQVQRTKLLQRRGRSSHDYPASVATTWSLSFERVAQNAVAADLLRLCAFLAPDAIPEEIVIKGASHLGEHLQGVVEDEGLLDEAIGTLRAYSLIRRDTKEKTLSIHRLVQAVLRDAMSNEETKLWTQQTVLAVNAVFPYVEFAQWAACERCLPHALVCADLVEQEGLMFTEAAFLLNSAGIYLYERGRYSEAEPLYVRALSIYEQQLGAEHPSTAASLHNLAGLYQSQGKYTEAEPLYVRALSISERHLGPDHPDTAAILNSLAFLYQSQGKYTEAEPLYLRALAIKEQQLGPDHPDTASNLNNLASLYESQGKYSQAEPLYLRALSINERQLGAEHPSTAASLHHLAGLYESQGKYTEAEPLYLRVLSISERHLGPDHPETATSLHNLAGLYVSQGKYTEAEPLYLRAFSIYEQQLGPEHPSTAASLHHLAGLYQSQGKYTEAEPLCQRALSIRERHLGAEHPNTADSLSNLAGLYQSQGKYTEAEPLYRRALSIREQHLGPEHPSTAASLHHLAGLYQSQGKYTEAEPLCRRALSIRERHLGAEHPYTAASLSNLAGLYQSQGKYTEAEPLYRRAISINERQLGPEHPSTAASLHNLALLYKSQGKYTEVEPLYLRALAIEEQQLGKEHPNTASSLSNLAGLYMSQGKYTEAEPLYLRALAIEEQQLGKEHPDTATGLNNLAVLYESQGKYTEAEPLYLRALSISERQLGPEHPDTASSLSNLAGLYMNQGKYTEAEQTILRALAIEEQQLGKEHPDTATGLNNLALLYHNQGKYTEAEPLYLRALQILEQSLGPQHPNTQQTRQNYADLLRAMGRDEEAEQIAPDDEINAMFTLLLQKLLHNLGNAEHDDENEVLLQQLQQMLGRDGLLALLQELLGHIDDDEYNTLLALAQQLLGNEEEEAEQIAPDDEINAMFTLLLQKLLHNLGNAEHDDENEVLLQQLQQMLGRDGLLSLLQELLGHIDDDEYNTLLALAQQLLGHTDDEAKQIERDNGLQQRQSRATYGLSNVLSLVSETIGRFRHFLGRYWKQKE